MVTAMPPIIGREHHIYPDGIIFRLGNKSNYDKIKQQAYWRTLLQSAMFKPKSHNHPDFAENMIFTLYDHAKWHYYMKEYDMAKFLCLQAMLYRDEPRPDILARTADCMVFTF